MAEEWVRNAQDEATAEAHSWANAEKALGAFKEKHVKLTKKLREAKSACLSAEAGLKITKALVENPRKKLYTTEIKLAT